MRYSIAAYIFLLQSFLIYGAAAPHIQAYYWEGRDNDSFRHVRVSYVSEPFHFYSSKAGVTVSHAVTAQSRSNNPRKDYTIGYTRLNKALFNAVKNYKKTENAAPIWQLLYELDKLYQEADYL